MTKKLADRQQQQIKTTNRLDCKDEIVKLCQNCLRLQFLIDDLTHQLTIERKMSFNRGQRIEEFEAENCKLQTSAAVVQHNLNDKLLVIETLQNYINQLEHGVSVNMTEIQELKHRIQTQELEKSTKIHELSQKLSESMAVIELGDSILLKSTEESGRLMAELELCRTHVNDCNVCVDQLRAKNRDLSSELVACQGLIERYEEEKGRIEENISVLTQSSMSDRNKYELIKHEKEELSMKLLVLNEQLHHIKSVAEPPTVELKNDVDDRPQPAIPNEVACQTENYNGDDELANHSTVKHLKILIKVLEKEHREKIKRYELNMRTLLKKVSCFEHKFS